MRPSQRWTVRPSPSSRHVLSDGIIERLTLGQTDGRHSVLLAVNSEPAAWGSLAGSFLGNRVVGGGGGAAAALFGSSLTLTGGMFRGNAALAGPGGVALALNGSTLLVNGGAAMADSSAAGGYGGTLAGIYDNNLNFTVRVSLSSCLLRRLLLLPCAAH